MRGNLTSVAGRLHFKLSPKRSNTFCEQRLSDYVSCHLDRPIVSVAINITNQIVIS